MKQSLNYRRLYTVINAFGIFTVGIIQTIPGQAIADLETLIKTSTSNISYGFSVSSFTSAIGALFLGYSYKFFNRQFLFILQFLLMGTSSLVTPHIHTLFAYLTTQALFGFALGGLISLQNVLVLEMWEEKSNPYMQATHFCWSLGSTVAPLISAPFLSAETNKTDTENPIMNVNDSTIQATNESIISATVQSENPQLWIPFTTGGSLAVLAAIIISVVELVSPYQQPPRSVSRKADEAGSGVESANAAVVSKCTNWLFIGLCSFILALFLNIEIMAFYFLPIFLQSSPLKISSKRSSYMFAVFGAAHTAMRGLAILISTRIKPQRMVYACLVTVAVANLLIFICYDVSERMLLLPLALLGFGLSPTYPAFHSFVEQHIDETNLVAGVIQLISMTPNVISPLVLGETMKSWPLFFIYMNGFQALGAILLFVVANWMGKRFYSPT